MFPSWPAESMILWSNGWASKTNTSSSWPCNKKQKNVILSTEVAATGESALQTSMQWRPFLIPGIWDAFAWRSVACKSYPLYHWATVAPTGIEKFGESLSWLLWTMCEPLRNWMKIQYKQKQSSGLSSSIISNDISSPRSLVRKLSFPIKAAVIGEDRTNPRTFC